MILAAPPLTVTEHDGVQVVRDDLILGGTKVRFLPGLLPTAPGWVYAGPAEGYAQLALGLAALQRGGEAHVFIPKRTALTPVSAAARHVGVSIHEVPAGRLNVLQARARRYAHERGLSLLPFGLAVPGAEAAIARMAAPLDVPAVAYVASGSGLLHRGLSVAWPGCELWAVQVGHPPVVWSNFIHEAPEPFAKPAGRPPPYPSVITYDAKAWRYARANRAARPLLWNVAGPLPPFAVIDRCLAAGSLSLAAYA